jgi:transposase-like protein
MLVPHYFRDDVPRQRKAEGGDDAPQGAHFGQDLILTYIREYVAYPLSSRESEEMMQERALCGC